jgi:hypothetical protein
MGLWKPSRRLFLAGAGLIAAPAIVRAQSPQIRQLLLKQMPVVTGGANGLLTGLISYWKMDEASGANAIDSQGADLLVSNATVGAGTGIINGARTFNGTSQFLSHVDDTNLNVFGTDFSLAFWVNLNAVTTQVLVSKREGGAASTAQYTFYCDATITPTRFNFFVSNGTTFFPCTATTFGVPPTSVWNFIAVVVDDTAKTMKISVNAGAQDTTSYTGSIPARTGSDALRVGAEQSPAATFLNGSFDEFGFWKRKLSTTDITNLYNSGAGLPFSSFT